MEKLFNVIIGFASRHAYQYNRVIEMCADVNNYGGARFASLKKDNNNCFRKSAA